MNSDILRFRLKPGAIAILAMVGALLTPGALALAQPGPAQPSPPTPTAETLTVFAPRVVVHEATTGSRRFHGSPVEVLSLSRTVSFADLDLTTQAGVDEFYKRILYSALAACDQMESEYPSNVYVPVPADQNCPDATARAAMTEADEIIVATKAQAR